MRFISQTLGGRGFKEKGLSGLMALMQLLFVSGVGTIQAANKNVLEVAPATRAVVTVNADSVIREKLPSTLFGFNINHYHFQKDFWQKKQQRVNDKIIKALKPFHGALYRYPGGLIANRFWWKQAIGPSSKRKAQKAVKSQSAYQVLFGVDEYLDFVRSVGGHQWYVLNLVGWDTSAMIKELPGQYIAESNAELATYLKQHDGNNGSPRYYQLGNELDRADYEWTHEKYIERAKSTMEAIRSVDPEARFVAFLRDYDRKYKGGVMQGSVSRYQKFIKDVLEGLPEIDDFSMHFYYDESEASKKYKRISWRLRQFRRAIDVAGSVRKGKELNVWITEHARGIDVSAGQANKSKDLTSNLAATLSTADFLIALAQFPEVKGACWHGLNAGPWQLFDATIRYKDLRPRPIYWGLRVLRTMDLPVVLATHTSSPNHSGYAGGYDIRSVAFTDEVGEKLGLWMVNRASRSTEVEIRYAPWQKQAVNIQHYYVAGKEGGDPSDPYLSPEVQLNPTGLKSWVSESGSLTVKLPPASISSIVISITSTSTE